MNSSKPKATFDVNVIEAVNSDPETGTTFIPRMFEFSGPDMYQNAHDPVKFWIKRYGCGGITEAKGMFRKEGHDGCQVTKMANRVIAIQGDMEIKLKPSGPFCGGLVKEYRILMNNTDDYNTVLRLLANHYEIGRMDPVREDSDPKYRGL